MKGESSGKKSISFILFLAGLFICLLVSRIYLNNINVDIFLIILTTACVFYNLLSARKESVKSLEAVSAMVSVSQNKLLSDKEFDDPSAALLSVLKEMNLVFDGLAEHLEDVVTFSRQVSSESEKIALGADAQTFSLDETGKSVQGISSSITNLVEMVERLFPHAERATSSILEMVDSNKKISLSSQDLLGQVKEVSSDIGDMVGSVKEIERRFMELSSSSADTSRAVQRIDYTIKEIEEKARFSSDLAEQGRRDAEMGAESSAKTIEGMNHIKDIVSESAKVIERLGQKSGEIGDIINVIDEVTDRTNLLALNASIIAAQAGEHGKGFAVVAGEIKKLAEQTASSTIEISGLIKSIQSMVADAVQANELGTWSVEEGVRLSHEAGGALRKILESTKKASEMSRLIAEATINQSSEARQVLDSIQGEVGVIQIAASSMRDHAQRSEKILDSATRMLSLTQEVTRANMEQEKANTYVTKVIEEVKTLVKGMFDVTRTQKTDSDQIKQAIEIIGFISTENIKGLRDLADAVKELSGRLDMFHDKFMQMKP